VTAILIEYWAPKNAFIYIMGAAFSGLIFSWAVSLAAHISFRRRIASQQLAALPMHSPLGTIGSILGFILASAAILNTLFATRINLWGGLTFFAVLTVAYQFLKSRRTGQ